jgi:radical SAM superfamily enzyme YgiQ (UPF0313 family)
VDFLLISPPVGNPGQAVAALSVLTAYLRARGWDAHQWDLAIDAFHHFHSAVYLERCRDRLRARGADPELEAAAGRAVGDIDAAKELFRRPDAAAKPDAMRWAFGVLGDAGVLMTAASLGRYEHDFRHFDIPGAGRDFDALGAALDDPEANPFLEFMEEHALPRLRRASPRAIGISITYFSQLIPAFTLARLVRQHLPRTRLVLGGSYLTATASDVRRMPSALVPADAIILHDGEAALDLWLGSVLGDQDDPGDVPNLHLRRGDAFRPASERPPRPTELAALPVPMWTGDGLELDRYLVPKYAIPLPLTRGCHWGRCVYCNISSQTSGHYRWRGSELALADLGAIMAETGSNWFDFPVDSFHPRDLSELSRAILGAGLAVEWGAEVLLDPGFTEPVVAELARAGCRCLRFGLESGAPATLKAMRKPTRPESAARVLAACRQHGIRTGVMVIAGFPTETQAELGATYDFLVNHREHIDFVAIHPYSLVPGSAMAQDPGRFGLYLRPGAPVLTSSVPFTNTNPVGMQNEDLPRVIAAMREGLGEHYPDLGELWTAAIGGWMTFPACCAVER